MYRIKLILGWFIAIECFSNILLFLIKPQAFPLVMVWLTIFLPFASYRLIKEGNRDRNKKKLPKIETPSQRLFRITEEAINVNKSQK